NDLIFPHHENEIAQSEAFSGKVFARYWIHNGMLQLSGEKMSKSIGNLVTIEEFLSKHTADSLRFMVLNSGYRSPLTFNDEVIGQAERALERLVSALKPAYPEAGGINAEQLAVLKTQTNKTGSGYKECMDDDFNSAGALGNLFDLVRVINQARADGATDEQLEEARGLLKEFSGVMGLSLSGKTSALQAEPFIELLLEVRANAREQKLWALSDLIRDRLAELGVQVEDAKGGSAWTWK
ncbi:MAG: class I tRNA ligase family protein, partial [Kiritimatiellota bacterium]|nr:class I tRNA ligase family protein [Kiritimatiellota bacterium]